MFVARNLDELASGRRMLGAAADRIAFVPTMGSLHDGHIALVDAARRDGRAVAVSIFVNPLQFEAASDLARYPVDHERDLALLRDAGCDLAWLPDNATMYPAGHATHVEVGGPAEDFEGRFRPGHFRGVATVVTILLNQVRPQVAWFGEKDWQQLQVVRRITRDLQLGVEVRALPTVRDVDGLALSSRNRFLTADERARAPRLFETLSRAADRMRAGRDVVDELDASREMLAGAGLHIDYLALVDADSLDPLNGVRHASRLLAAARLGTVRLLDNVHVA